ncbi:hypothetical protein AB0F72_25940 [Actinoplanes sp. NPDC023936]|uniref:hypothetical protein n=1 Tax=Actinoplanes sp. NPDC023936 TaxID=3154910 RepID=UPI0033F6523F
MSASAPPGAPDSLEAWRAQNGPAFSRACAALIAAAQVTSAPRTSTPGPIRNMLTVLLPAVAGALLTWLFATQLAERGARRLQATALRSAKRQYDREAQSLIDGRAAQESGPMPPPDAWRAARVDLVNQLEEIAASHRGWTEPGTVQKLLEGQELADAIDDVRHDGPPETAAAARAMVRALLARVEKVAVAVERPRRERAAMRPEAGPGVVMRPAAGPGVAP